MRLSRLQVALLGAACFYAGSLVPTLPNLAHFFSQSYGASASARQVQPLNAPLTDTEPAVQQLKSNTTVESVIFASSAAYMASARNALNATLLIVSPVRNRGSGHKTPIAHFFELVRALDWPKALTSLVVLEGDSTDDTWDRIGDGMTRLAGAGYRRLRRVKKDFGPLPSARMGGSDSVGHEARHAIHAQLERRVRLATVRNWLLSQALEDEDWVLWIDSDLWSAPSDLVQQLLAAAKPLVVPNCVVEGSVPPRTYDLNSWQETEESRALQKQLDPEAVLFEGCASPRSKFTASVVLRLVVGLLLLQIAHIYCVPADSELQTRRKHIGSIGMQGNVVRLDGIGGAAILVHGDLHRAGLVFPPFVLDHAVETEGMAKMAARMGYPPHGIPTLHVSHK
eukprot:SAG31_NODE_1141_length_9699_cov_4.487604_4_plen_396_part_00